MEIQKANRPDVKGPRFRPPKYRVLNPDFIKRFKDKFPQYKALPDMEIRKIIKTYNEELWKGAIENRDGIEIPEGLGYVFIGTCRPPKVFNTDYGNSNRQGLKLRHRNFESDNYLAKIFYTNFASKYKFQYRDLWQFKGIRNFTRTVASTFPANWKKYIIVESYHYISSIFMKSIKNSAVINKGEKEVNTDYNEFEMN